MVRATQLPQGISLRHARGCPASGGGRCSCKPTYQAQVYDRRARKRVTRTFPTLAAARAWRQDAAVEVRRGELSANAGMTIAEAADRWLALAGTGAIRNRSGDPYKPSALRSYEGVLRVRIADRLGSRDLASLTRTDLQRFIGDMLADGLDPSTVRNTLMPIRAIYRDADQIAGFSPPNPTKGLRLPAVRGRRERVVTPAEAAELLDALDPRDRALWATALYAGLRRGELRGLLWSDVDLDKRVIRVVRAWDQHEGFITPKSQAGARTVPIARLLLTELRAHAASVASMPEHLVFGRAAAEPFNPATVVKRAKRNWGAAGLSSVGLHDCRHTFASLMIAAGVNAKALSVFMGHASITVTLDRYGHLFPGSEDQAASLLDTYLASPTQSSPDPGVGRERLRLVK